MLDFLWRRQASPSQPVAATLQTVSFWGCVCLVSNNILGPGTFSLPGLFQEAGWVLALVFCLCAALWSSQSSVLLAAAISEGVEGNKDFSKNIELSSLASLLLPPWGALLVLLVVVLNLFSQTVQLILVLTQACDEALLQVFGRTCALNLSKGSYDCVALTADREVATSLYGDSFVVSSGFVSIMAVCLPLSLISLNENIMAQVVAFLVIILQFLVWTLNFFTMGLNPSLMPAFGAKFAPLIPQAFYSFNFLATVTATLATKRPDVNGPRAILTGVSFALGQTLLVSVFGGLAVAMEGGSNTSLSNVLAQAPPPGVWRASSHFSFVFPFANILTAIPVFCIFMQRNLEEFFGAGVRTKRVALAIAVACPWLVALAFYPLPSFSSVINWTSAFTVVPMNLTVPLALYLVYVARRKAGLPPACHPTGLPGATPGSEGGLLAEALTFVQSPLSTVASGSGKVAEWEAGKAHPAGAGESASNPQAAIAVAEGGSKNENEGGREKEGLHCACRACGVAELAYARALFAASLMLSLVAFALQCSQAAEDASQGPPPSTNSTALRD
jgi:hypothetical protein